MIARTTSNDSLRSSVAGAALGYDRDGDGSNRAAVRRSCLIESAPVRGWWRQMEVPRVCDERWLLSPLCVFASLKPGFLLHVPSCSLCLSLVGSLLANIQ
jgi:hypothetical protein